VFDRGRLPRFERCAHEFRRSAVSRVEGAERRDELRLVRRGDQPERTCARPGSLHRDPHRLLRGPADVAARGERLTCQPEPFDAAARRGRPTIRSQRSHGERQLGCDEVGDGALVLVERRGDTEQLHRADHPSAGMRRNGEQTGCAGALGRPSDGLGDLARRNRLARRPCACDLGSERRSLGCDGACRQVAVGGEHPQNRQVGLGCAGGDERDRGQRSAQIRRRSDLCRGVGEQFDGQPPGLDDHRRKQYCLHFGDG